MARYPVGNNPVFTMLAPGYFVNLGFERRAFFWVAA